MNQDTITLEISIDKATRICDIMEAYVFDCSLDKGLNDFWYPITYVVYNPQKDTLYLKNAEGSDEDINLNHRIIGYL